jgi:hypothetical protein
MRSALSFEFLGSGFIFRTPHSALVFLIRSLSPHHLISVSPHLFLLGRSDPTSIVSVKPKYAREYVSNCIDKKLGSKKKEAQNSGNFWLSNGDTQET